MKDRERERKYTRERDREGIYKRDSKRERYPGQLSSLLNGPTVTVTEAGVELSSNPPGARIAKLL